jgi:hypothetical protein
VSQKPDFSGEYVLNRTASPLEGGAAAVQGAVLRIEHRDPTFRCQGEFSFEGTTSNWEFELTADDGAAAGEEPPTTASLRWDGVGLMVTMPIGEPDVPVTMTWRYELDDDGRRLTAIERIRGGGRDQDNLWMFERR